MELGSTPRNGGAEPDPIDDFDTWWHDRLEMLAWAALIVGLMGFIFVMGLALVRMLLL